jgi:hypothetical protein
MAPIVMRLMQVSGSVLIVIGVWIVLQPPSYSREDSVFKLGNIEATVRREHPLPPWVGGGVAGTGLVLLVLGLIRR